jgi:hypothetical protein
MERDKREWNEIKGDGSRSEGMEGDQIGIE